MSRIWLFNRLLFRWKSISWCKWTSHFHQKHCVKGVQIRSFFWSVFSHNHHLWKDIRGVFIYYVINFPKIFDPPSFVIKHHHYLTPLLVLCQHHPSSPKKMYCQMQPSFRDLKNSAVFLIKTRCLNNFAH